MNCLTTQSAIKPENSHPAKIFGETVYILERTAYPQTFFPRRILLSELLQSRADTGEQNAIEQLAKFRQDTEKDIDCFLKRAYAKVLQDTDRLKVKICKLKRFDTFLQELLPYYEQLTPANRAYLEEIKKDFRLRTYRW